MERETKATKRKSRLIPCMDNWDAPPERYGSGILAIAILERTSMNIIYGNLELSVEFGPVHSVSCAKPTNPLTMPERSTPRWYLQIAG